MAVGYLSGLIDMMAGYEIPSPLTGRVHPNCVTLYSGQELQAAMKNITLSADEGLIDEARRIAASRSTTLDAEFRQWLSDYVGRHQQAEKAMSTIHERQEVIHTGGRKFTREVMNERQHTDAANWLADAGGSAPDLEDIPRRRSETPDSIPDYENMSLKELIENCPLERIDLERPMEYPRDIEF